MRYKVKAESAADYERLKRAVSARTHVFTASERRLTLSIGEVDERVLMLIQRLGGIIQPDFQYAPEEAAFG